MDAHREHYMTDSLSAIAVLKNLAFLTLYRPSHITPKHTNNRCKTMR